jgi:ankyrin repeat protein
MDERLKGAIESGNGGAVDALLRDSPGLAHDSIGVLSAVMFAAYYKQPSIAHKLLDARGPADLFEAAALGLTDRMRALVCWDPRAVAARSEDGFTSLHLSAYFGHPDTVRLLLNAGAYVEAIAENASKVRPLHSGVAGGNLQVVEALLAAHADVESRQERGFTPLMGAAAGGEETIVRRLLDLGADRCATNDEGRTAMDLAREHHHEHLATLLEQ